MNMINTEQTIEAAALQVISPQDETTIVLTIPSELQPLLSACCAHWKVTPEKYALAALLSSLDCDEYEIRDVTRKALDHWRAQ